MGKSDRITQYCWKCRVDTHFFDPAKCQNNSQGDAISEPPASAPGPQNSPKPPAPAPTPASASVASASASAPTAKPSLPRTGKRSARLKNTPMVQDVLKKAARAASLERGMLDPCLDPALASLPTPMAPLPATKLTFPTIPMVQGASDNASATAALPATKLTFPSAPMAQGASDNASAATALPASKLTFPSAPMAQGASGKASASGGPPQGSKLTYLSAPRAQSSNPSLAAGPKAQDVSNKASISSHLGHANPGSSPESGFTYIPAIRASGMSGKASGAAAINNGFGTLVPSRRFKSPAYSSQVSAPAAANSSGPGMVAPYYQDPRAVEYSFGPNHSGGNASGSNDNNNLGRGMRAPSSRSSKSPGYSFGQDNSGQASGYGTRNMSGPASGYGNQGSSGEDSGYDISKQASTYDPGPAGPSQSWDHSSNQAISGGYGTQNISGRASGYGNQGTAGQASGYGNQGISEQASAYGNQGTAGQASGYGNQGISEQASAGGKSGLGMPAQPSQSSTSPEYSFDQGISSNQMSGYGHPGLGMSAPPPQGSTSPEYSSSQRMYNQAADYQSAGSGMFGSSPQRSQSPEGSPSRDDAFGQGVSANAPSGQGLRLTSSDHSSDQWVYRPVSNYSSLAFQRGEFNSDDLDISEQIPTSVGAGNEGYRMLVEPGRNSSLISPQSASAQGSSFTLNSTEPANMVSNNLNLAPQRGRANANQPATSSRVAAQTNLVTNHISGSSMNLAISLSPTPQPQPPMIYNSPGPQTINSDHNGDGDDSNVKYSIEPHPESPRPVRAAPTMSVNSSPPTYDEATDNPNVPAFAQAQAQTQARVQTQPQAGNRDGLNLTWQGYQEYLNDSNMDLSVLDNTGRGNGAPASSNSQVAASSYARLAAPNQMRQDMNPRGYNGAPAVQPPPQYHHLRSPSIGPYGPGPVRGPPIIDYNNYGGLPDAHQHRVPSSGPGPQNMSAGVMGIGMAVNVGPDGVLRNNNQGYNMGGPNAVPRNHNQGYNMGGGYGASAPQPQQQPQQQPQPRGPLQNHLQHFSTILLGANPELIDHFVLADGRRGVRICMRPMIKPPIYDANRAPIPAMFVSRLSAYAAEHQVWAREAEVTSVLMQQCLGLSNAIPNFVSSENGITMWLVFPHTQENADKLTRIMADANQVINALAISQQWNRGMVGGAGGGNGGGHAGAPPGVGFRPLQPGGLRPIEPAGFGAAPMMVNNEEETELDSPTPNSGHGGAAAFLHSQAVKSCKQTPIKNEDRMMGTGTPPAAAAAPKKTPAAKRKVSGATGDSSSGTSGQAAKRKRLAPKSKAVKAAAAAAVSEGGVAGGMDAGGPNGYNGYNGSSPGGNSNSNNSTQLTSSSSPAGSSVFQDSSSPPGGFPAPSS
ncbi:hypothetical protein MBM_05888 [Drepanopeziza brunnea f. sp. 'multigermtubi' MB_m1]|uniref:Uncharacterized protein n=1 Tax=Marssonina brunnea f. sp. multigermtubi (strain MB_m1) TaxID=1072389 RepID=K1WTU4_MARBU|nr:uncharacterized protein MBM_05888 [Drepanopeziza brunnea f. sp. 'multigermtubi' MB_m1]EKD15877.1 hypothetical protein MBM_05888 [Drepanopeziza brunnea f. sp. 'multigermtubi' MB_m1]